MPLYDPCCTTKCNSALHARMLLALASRFNISPEEFALAARCLCRRRIDGRRLVALHDVVGRSLLHISAVYDNYPLLCDICGKCTNKSVNERDGESGWTPLHYAVFYGNFACGRHLIKAGADLNTNDGNVINPLQMCVFDSTRLPNEILSDIPDTTSMKRTDATPPSYLGWYDIAERRVDTVTWGQNRNFTLGYGTDHEKPVPDTSLAQARGSDDEILDIVMRKFHTVFRMRNGQVFGVGNGAGGRLGETSGMLVRLSEIRLPGFPRIIQIAAGENHSVFLTDSGQVWACGRNTHNQLGLPVVPIGTAQSVPHVIHFATPHSISSTQTKSSSSSSYAVIPQQQSVHIRLIKAERYHTVYASNSSIFVAGYNVGQFGPSVGGQPTRLSTSSADQHQPPTHNHYAAPTELTCFTAAEADRHLPLKSIECSDAAMLLHAADDSLLLLHNFKRKRLPTGPARDAAPEELGIFGGRIGSAAAAGATTSARDIVEAKAAELVIMGLYNTEHSVMQKRQDTGAADDESYNGNQPLPSADLPRSIRKHFAYTNFQSHSRLPARSKALPRAMADVSYRRELYCLKRVAPRQYEWRLVRLENVPHEHSYIRTFRICSGKVIVADVFGQVYVATFDPNKFALFHIGSSKAVAANQGLLNNSSKFVNTSGEILTTVPLVLVANRIVHLQGVERVFCEPSGRNFAAIRRLPVVEMRSQCYTSEIGAMSQHRLFNERSLRESYQKLYEERSDTGDCTVVWSGVECPAHAFVVLARCRALRKQYSMPAISDTEADENGTADPAEENNDLFEAISDGNMQSTRILLRNPEALPPGDMRGLLDDFVKYLYFAARLPPPSMNVAQSADSVKKVDSPVKPFRRKQLAELCAANGVSVSWLTATDAAVRGNSLAHVSEEFGDAWHFQPDSVIVCEQDKTRLPCHRAILVARCEYFSTMFMPGHWQEDMPLYEPPTSSFALSNPTAVASSPMPSFVVEKPIKKPKTDFCLPCTESVGKYFLRWIYAGCLVNYVDNNKTKVASGENDEPTNEEPSSSGNKKSRQKMKFHENKAADLRIRAQLHIDLQDLCGLQSLADFVLMPDLKRAVEPLLVLHIDLNSVSMLIQFAQQTNASLVYRYGHYFLARSIKFLLDSAGCSSDSFESLPDDVLALVSQIYRNSAQSLRTSAGEAHAVLQPILRRSDFRQISRIEELDGVNFDQLLDNVRRYMSSNEQQKVALFEEEPPGYDLKLTEDERRAIELSWKSEQKAIPTKVAVVRRSKLASGTEDGEAATLSSSPRTKQLINLSHASSPTVQRRTEQNYVSVKQTEVPVNSTAHPTNSTTPVAKASAKPSYWVQYEKFINNEEARMLEYDLDSSGAKKGAGDAPPLIIPRTNKSPRNSVDREIVPSISQPMGGPDQGQRPKSNPWETKSVPQQNSTMSKPMPVAPTTGGSSLSSIMEQEAALKRKREIALQQQQQQQAAAAAAAERSQKIIQTPPRDITGAKLSPWSMITPLAPTPPQHQSSFLSESPAKIKLDVSPKQQSAASGSGNRKPPPIPILRQHSSLYADNGGDTTYLSSGMSFSSSPTPAVPFNAIQQSEIKAIDAAHRQSRQAFALVEIEERAIHELRALYGGENCPEQFILVGRVRPQVTPAQPHWT